MVFVIICTIDAINASLEEVTDNLDSQLKYSMLSLDLSKALDTINRNILINKLRNIRMRCLVEAYEMLSIL